MVEIPDLFGQPDDQKKKPTKQAWVREYDARRCAHPGCTVHPSFGYGPPFCKEQAWTCREHRAWFEASVQEGKAA